VTASKLVEKEAMKKPVKSLEESCRNEVGEAEAAFRGRLAKEDKRRRLATDSEFWIAVYFQSREEKDRFLRKYGLDKVGDKYLPGNAVDRILDRRTTAKDGHRKER
jgi:hypothetical protein